MGSSKNREGRRNLLPAVSSLRRTLHRTLFRLRAAALVLWRPQWDRDQLFRERPLGRTGRVKTKTLNLFFHQLLAMRQLMRGHDFVFHFFGHVIVVRKFHGVR